MPVIHGFHPVREALRRRPHRVQAVLVSRRAGAARRREIESLCARHGVELRSVPESEITKIAGGHHQGFAAQVAELESHPGRGSDPDLVVLVEDVQDPRNLGALLRVCEAAGVGRLLIRDRGSAPLTPTVVQASAGASEWLPVERVTNSTLELERLKKEGYWVYGTAPEGLPPWEVDLSGRTVLCFGGEEKGLRQRTRGTCDALLGLPMRGRVESLNLATAAAAVLYEALRQRRGGDGEPDGLPGGEKSR